ncbi:MAG: hypothetical protein AB1425_10555 [Actinomycetota bacterium]
MASHVHGREDALAAGSNFERRRARRRRGRLITGILLFAALGALLVAGVLTLAQSCGAGSAEEPLTSRGEPADGGEAPQQTTDEPAGGKKNEEPEQPFGVIPPPEDRSVAGEPRNGLDQGVLEDIAIGRLEGSAASAQYGEEEETTVADPGAERSVPEGRTLLAGTEDRTDGPLKEHRLVAYYGHPWEERMGILGEYAPEEMMRRLKEQTAAYSAADPGRPAVPMIELIASVAQRDPGPDGLYVAQTPAEEIEKYSKLAKKHDALLMLDVQLGSASVMHEVKILEPFLKQPHVHLAIDTEYSVEPGEVPGVDLGEVDGTEIQEAVNYLDELVEREDLPDKVLMVHQFEAGIVTNKRAIEPTDDVEVVLHADGFGGPEDKFTKYRLLVRDDPIQYGGFKVFYRQDTPVLNPEQILTLDPAPAVVTYQ